jgi:hypothetical protein
MLARLNKGNGFMPRHDTHHEAVKRALEKDGWTITADPFIIGLGQARMYADLGAEKDVRLIIVEIKTFLGDSFVNELHRATGQYSNYRSLLRRTADPSELFLAVPLEIYQKYFGQEYVRVILEDLQINLLVYDAEQEEIAQWIH